MIKRSVPLFHYCLGLGSSLTRFSERLPTMTTSNFDELPVEPNSLLIRKALSILCGKWRLYILLVLGERTLRYSQFSEQLPGVSEKVLAGELKTLVSLGVMQRTVYAEIPPRVEYTLTQKGRSALPLLRQIQQIGLLIS